MFSVTWFAPMSPDESVSRANEEVDERDAEEGYDYEGTEEEYEEGSYDEGRPASDSQLAPNQILVTLSYSLMNQLKQTARMEGVSVDDIVIELLSEGATRRMYEDASRPAPSHLMTRTGYVPPDANGNVMQPSMSHHNFNSQGNGNNQRRGQNNQRRNNNNGNYNKNYNNNSGGFNRYNNKKHNNQQRFNNNQGYRATNQHQQQQQQDSAPVEATPKEDKK